MTRKLTSIAALVAILACVSCSTFTVKPGSEPLVVYAEASAETTLNIFDAFLKWERANDVALRSLDPGIHQVAETVRKNGKGWIRELNTAIRLYKANKTDTNKSKLVLAQAVIDRIVVEIKAKTVKGNAI